MLKLVYKILKDLSKSPISISDFKRQNFIKHFSVENLFEDLEHEGCIEEIFSKELEANYPCSIDNMSGNMGQPTGLYRITSYGQSILEEERQERFRFYAPFVFSLILNIIMFTVTFVRN